MRAGWRRLVRPAHRGGRGLQAAPLVAQRRWGRCRGVLRRGAWRAAWQGCGRSRGKCCPASGEIPPPPPPRAARQLPLAMAGGKCCRAEPWMDPDPLRGPSKPRLAWLPAARVPRDVTDPAPAPAPPHLLLQSVPPQPPRVRADVDGRLARGKGVGGVQVRHQERQVEDLQGTQCEGRPAGPHAGMGATVRLHGGCARVVGVRGPPARTACFGGSES